MWTITLIVCFVVLAVIGIMQSVRWKVSRHVAGRVKLSETEFAERYFPGQEREVALKVRRLLVPYIPVNVGLVQPADRLVDDLGLAARFPNGLDMVSFAQDLEEEFKIEFSEEDYLQAQTFQDVVGIILKKTAKG